MSWVVLIGDGNFNLDSIQNIKHYDSKSSYKLPFDRYAIQYDVDFIFYDQVRDLKNYYDKKDLDKIPYRNPNFILMSSSSDEVMEKVLKQDNFLKDVYVDNDHGSIVPIDKFILN